jgi:N-acetyl-anhydromuramyl-L-alanine amidase AmpD
MVRLNNGYSPGGTLPPERHYPDFARRCANFVRASAGSHIWIVGNEPNHPIEWPGAVWNWGAAPPRPISEDQRGEPITPTRYVRCYRLVREAIKAVPGHANDLVLLAAVAPWNNLLTYTGNSIGDWVRYFQDILVLIGPAACDGITLHAYTHGGSPALITSETRMDAPFQNRRFHFRSYRDFMAAVPANMRHLPVFVTETDQGDDPWRDENSGWVRAAHAEIHAWNKANSQHIRSLILYRWPQVPGDRWGIAGKAGVIEDFRASVAAKYRWDFEDPLVALSRRTEDLERREMELQPAVARLKGYLATLARLRSAAGDLSARASVAPAAELRADLAEIDAGLRAIEAELGIDPQPAAIPTPMPLDVRASLPVHASLTYPTRPVSGLRRVVVHHTAAPGTLKPERIAEVQIRAGKPGITYHFYIKSDGSVYYTQSVERNTAQTARSDVNATAIGVCLGGNFTNTPPGPKQLGAAAELIAWLLAEHGLPPEAIVGRRELDSTASPGDQWLRGAAFKKDLVRRVRAILEPARLVEPPQVTVGGLFARIESLEARIAELAITAAQVPGLEAEITALKAEREQLGQEIESLRRQLSECAGSGQIARPQMVYQVDRLARHPTLPPYPNRTRPVTAIIIHHADTPKTMSVEAIARYHVFGERKDAQGKLVKGPWPSIGYHFVIDPAGLIHECQREETRSFHVGGEPNEYSVGVSLIGRFMTKNYDGTVRPAQDQVPTAPQLASTARLVAWLMQEHRIPLAQVHGHGEVWPGATVCPGEHWKAGRRWGDALTTQIKAMLAGSDRAELVDDLPVSDLVEAPETTALQGDSGPAVDDSWTIPEDWEAATSEMPLQRVKVQPEQSAAVEAES